MLSNKLKVLSGIVLAAFVLVLTQMPPASAQTTDSSPNALTSLWSFGGDALAFFNFQKPAQDANNGRLQNDANVTVNADCVSGQKTWDGGGATNNWSEAANWTCDALPAIFESAIFDATSTRNATIDVSPADGVHIRINSGYSGTVTSSGTANIALDGFTQNAGAFVCGAGTLTARSNNSITLNGGTFDCSAANFDARYANIVLNGGTFELPTGTFTLGDANGAGSLKREAAATLNHNSGTIVLRQSNINFVGAAQDFNNVSVTSSGNNLNGTMRVLGTLNLQQGNLGNSGGIVEIPGNLIVSQTYGLNGFGLSRAILKITGNAARTVTLPAGMPARFNPILLDAPNVLLNLIGAGTVSFETVTLNQGTIETGATGFEIEGVYTQNGGAFTCGGGLVSTVSNNSFNLSGGRFDCTASNIDAPFGVFNLTGGIFDMPSGTFTLGAQNGAGSITRGANATLNHSGGTLVLRQSNITFTGAAQDFNNVSVTSSGNNLNGTMRVLGTLSLQQGNLGTSAGIVEIPGNLIVSQTYGLNGFGLSRANLRITGNAARTITLPAGMPARFNPVLLDAPNVLLNLIGAGTVSFETLTLNQGTIETGATGFDINGVYTQNSGSFTCGGGLVNFIGGGGPFTLNGGTFNCAASSITASNEGFVLNNGTFNMPSGTFDFDNSSLTRSATAVLNHSNGTFRTFQNATVRFDGVSGNGTGTQDFNSVSVQSSTFALSGTIQTFGQLNLQSGVLKFSTINAKADVTVGNQFAGNSEGDTNLIFSGTANQTYTNNGGTNPRGTWTINKPDGTVTAATSLILGTSLNTGLNQPLNITSGTLYLNNNSNLTTGAITVGANGKLVNESATTITLGGNVSNSGAIDLQGGGAGCPENDSILIRSSDNATQRSWSGAGRYRLVDVDVKNMGGTGTKTVFSGTNSGGNNASWVFNSSCPTALSITPSSIGVQTGQTQTFTAGGGFPAYTFSILTNNSGGTINPTTGLYTAGATAGAIDTIRVTDAFGNTADATVNTFGAPNKLAFTVQPSNAAAGQIIQPPIQVTVQDQFGNTITNSSATVNISFAGLPADGVTLSGTTSKPAVNGVATFDNLSINRAGNYALRAVSSGLTTATSSQFSITAGAATQLAFIVQPSETVAGLSIAPPVQVAIQDAGGNTITTANNAVTIAVGNNPSGGNLSGTLTRSAVNGVATFSNLKIDKIGIGYTLLASSANFPAATSFAFNVIPFFVTNTNDSGAGSLRAALSGSATTIHFNIPGNAPFTIAPNSELPNFNSKIIDGTTQPGFSGTPIIELSGANAGNSIGLEIGNGNTIKSLVVNRFKIVGIKINGSDNKIRGNYIGTNAAGDAAAGNGTNGAGGDGGIFVNFQGTNNLIGGSTPAERNVISGNTGWSGIYLNGAKNLTIQGNYIGTNAAGNAAVPNVRGVFFFGSGQTLVGGTTPAERNVISGNTTGIQIRNGQTSPIPAGRILGNFIGTNAGGTAAVSNGTGVFLEQGSGYQIGGTASGEGNVIAFNAYGISTQSYLAPLPEKNVIRGNSIFSNTNYGIGISRTNDSQDPDTGANTRQNFPVLTSAIVSGGNTNISGTFNSTPSQTFTLDFYSSAACHSSGYGEGETYLGSRQVATGATGIVGFTANLPAPVAIGRVITATATDANGNTSEFSQCKTAAAALFSISGRITDNFGNPISGVSVGGQNIATAAVTDSSGNYVFNNLPGGVIYVLIPSKLNYLFTPGSLVFNNLSGNKTNQNFVGSQGTKISGRVQSNFNGILFPIAGVTVTLNDAANRTTVTDNKGNYTFANLSAGNYTVTPSQNNFTFNPASISQVLSNANLTANFTGTSFETAPGRIAFLSAQGISVMNPDGSAQVKPIADLIGCSKPSLSRDGGKIVAACSGTTGGSASNPIITMNFDGSNQQIVRSTGFNDNPVRSPNGPSIAFVERSGSTYSLRTINSDGSNIFTLDSGNQYLDFPNWSPDGTKITYAKTVNGQLQIFTVQSGGGNITQITSGVSHSRPVWSPDGSKIALIDGSNSSALDFKGNIFLIDPSTLSQTQITNNPIFREVAWSPDGTRLAFVTYIASTYGTINADGTNPTNILNNVKGISWSADFSPPTAAGANVNVTAGAASLTFGSVSAAGATTVTPIPPASAGMLPGGYVIGTQAYEITTTASVTPPIQVCFNVPVSIAPSQAAFNLLSIMHNENGVLIDRTTSRVFATRTICATTTSLSPFALAQQIDPNAPRISGLVLDNNGNPMSGVAVNLTGTETQFTQTDSDGAFNFVNLAPNGNYNVQPKEVGYLFSEYNQDFVNLTNEQTVVFQGAASNFSISGQVVDAGGGGLSNVTVNLDGAAQNSVQTDANGNYTFADLPADGFYTLSAFNGMNDFSPSNQIVDPLTSDAGGVNFNAVYTPTAAKVTISGKVVSAEGQAFSGAKVKLTDMNGKSRIVTANSFGNFNFHEVAAGETYIISVKAKFARFAPQFVSPVEDLSGITFTPSP